VPARDTYHHAVRNALIKDGWTITHDPYTLSFGLKDVFVDIGAERLLAAERGSERIAVEIKCFFASSDLHDFEQALGQFVFYRSLLIRTDPDRRLLLAVPSETFETTFQEAIARPVLKDLSVLVVAFDPDKEVFTEWIS
jgi:XisH protein